MQDKQIVVENENLPSGWLLMNLMRRGKLSDREFVTPDRKVLRSIQGVTEYMKISQSYTIDDIKGASKTYKKRMSL